MDAKRQTPTRDDGLKDFARARGAVFAVAYRMSGRPTDAEDVVQETWLRWQRCDRSAVSDPVAFLARTARNLTINEMSCARARHEVPLSDWTPALSAEDDPAATAERHATLESAVSMLTIRLTPTACAAFVLRTAFDYPYERIAEVVDTSPAAARQLVSRARHDLQRASTSRTQVAHLPDAAQRHLMREVVRAVRTADLARLEALLRREIGLVVRTSRRRHRPTAG